MTVHRLCLRRRCECGTSLTETGIAGLLLSVVVGIAMTVLYSGQTVVVGQQRRSVNNDQIRLAVEQIDREVRSGNLVYPPGDETPSGHQLRVYTQNNRDSLCVQWRIQDGRLQRRSWTPNYGKDVEPAPGWRTVAEGIANLGPSDAAPTGEPAFASASPHRTVTVSLLANADRSSRDSETVAVRTAITGRNAVNTFPFEACTPAPVQ